MSTLTGPAAVDCDPHTRVTKILLAYGVIAGPFYVAASLVQALLRPGFDVTRHSWSLLENGAFGWIQVVVFILTGLMVIAAAIGIGRQLPGRTAAALLGLYGAGMVGAGIFWPDPADGFPPGTPTGPGSFSWHGMLHLVCGGLGFLAFIAATVLIAVRAFPVRQPGWAMFSLLTGTVFLAAFAGISSGGTGPVVIAFTIAILLAWTWFTLLNLRLYRLAAQGTQQRQVAG
ncbi:MAG TPA: DUF998 domain-containing protein [Microbacteriaceae bacterium]